MANAEAADDVTPAGPVVIGYDGSDCADRAIVEAGRQLQHGRPAVVVCVWQPSNVGFVPVDDQPFDAQCAAEVRRAAERTAAHGASLAERAGFRAEALTVEAAPTWNGIVAVADERHASLVVMGSHKRSGFLGHLAGSVSSAVDTHFDGPVLIVREGC
jgi:nucleotide-binding universal stress UspA family protein